MISIGGITHWISNDITKNATHWSLEFFSGNAFNFSDQLCEDIRQSTQLYWVEEHVENGSMIQKLRKKILEINPEIHIATSLAKTNNISTVGSIDWLRRTHMTNFDGKKFEVSNVS